MEAGLRTLGVWLLLFTCLAARQATAQDDSVQYIRRLDRLRHVAFVPARQPCENWAVASAVQSVLEMEEVALPQSSLMTKLSGTDTCGPTMKVPSQLAAIIEGDYKLASGRTIHVEARLHDTYVDPGLLIKSIRENRPFLWIWSGHTYMVVGIEYVDAVHSSGLHEYDIQRIELMDPFGGAEQQPKIFQKTRTTLAQVDGIIEIFSSP